MLKLLILLLHLKTGISWLHHDLNMGLVEERHHNYIVDTKKNNKQNINIWIPNAKNTPKTGHHGASSRFLF